MKKLKSVILFLIIIPLCFFLKSCLNEPYTYQDYLIKVDSIHVPDTIGLNIPFDIEFFGIVGFDGCHRFAGFNQNADNNDIIIQAWGSYENKNGVCPAALVTLDGQKINMTFHTLGIYNIKIEQPDNSSIVRQITVN